MSLGLDSEARRQQGYSWPAILVASVATLCVPLITLIAALVLLDEEPFEPKRRLLKTWAWVSFALVACIVLFVVFILVSVP